MSLFPLLLTQYLSGMQVPVNGKIALKFLSLVLVFQKQLQIDATSAYPDSALIVPGNFWITNEPDIASGKPLLNPLGQLLIKQSLLTYKVQPWRFSMAT